LSGYILGDGSQFFGPVIDHGAIATQSGVDDRLTH
jgi:hypothetical protein